MKNESEILTERQRQAWTMRQQGLTYRKIAEAMDITSSAASQLVHNAERRFREYEKDQRIEARNQEIIQIELTRGEVELLLHLLEACSSKGSYLVREESASDWRKRLGYESFLIPGLCEKLQTKLYGKLIVLEVPEAQD